MLQPRIEIRDVDHGAAVPEGLFPPGIPADRTFRHEARIRHEHAGDESELLDEARVGHAAADAAVQPAADGRDLLRQRIAPRVLIPERRVEVLPLRDRYRGAGSQQVEHILAADAGRGARVALKRRVAVRPEYEDAVEGIVLAPVLHEPGDAVLLAAQDVAVEEEGALVGQRPGGAERRRSLREVLDAGDAGARSGP